MPRVVFYVPFNGTENSLAPVVLGLYVQLVASPLALNGDGEGQENSLKHPKISIKLSLKVQLIRTGNFEIKIL